MDDMTATRRSPWRMIGLALVLSAATGAGLLALVAREFDAGDCADAAARTEQVASLRVFDMPPPGARPSRGWEEAESECLDDSGEAWLAVTWQYDWGASRQSVMDHYRAAAGEDGWSVEPPDGGAGVPLGPADVCYAKDIEGGPVLLRIFFDTPGAFVVSVESSLDGTPMGC
ncbi:hypothetical protein SPRI_1122 [Streptomyces pristinaespiralis]|nr:hypothetical protein SPRI_1122 [Streptomyces pristinaespiralis]